MVFKVSAVLLMLLGASFVNAAHRGDGCFGTPNCIDTGLTCTGSRCYCYTDISMDIARFWACNDDQDCPLVKLPEKDVQSGSTEEKDTDHPIAPLGPEGKILSCIPSTECPLVPGFKGYCNVERTEHAGENSQISTS